MANTEEQRLDLIDNCNVLLEGILKPFEQTDNTPEGRMITQLKWLKERAEDNNLPLPVNEGYLATIRYVYTDGALCHHASSPEKVHEEIEAPQQKIIRLAKKGNLLYKPEYKPYVIYCIKGLIDVLGHSERTLSQYERELIQELYQMKRSLEEGKIVPPLGSQLPNYPNFCEVDRYEPTIADLPYGKELIKLINNLVFNGVRPDEWKTPEHAEARTIHYAGLYSV